MKILLTSDVHGNFDAYKELTKKYPQMDRYLDLGDSQLPENVIIPFMSVQGNCDFNRDYPKYRAFGTSFGVFLLTHIPYYQDSLISKFKPRVHIHGHTHVPKIAFENNLIVLNPGSLSYPRSDYGTTYMILDINENKMKVSIKEFPSHKELLSGIF